MITESKLVAEIYDFFDSFHLYRDKPDVSIKVNVRVENNYWLWKFHEQYR